MIRFVRFESLGRKKSTPFIHKKILYLYKARHIYILNSFYIHLTYMNVKYPFTNKVVWEKTILRKSGCWTVCSRLRGPGPTRWDNWVQLATRTARVRTNTSDLPWDYGEVGGWPSTELGTSATAIRQRRRWWLVLGDCATARELLNNGRSAIVRRAGVHDFSTVNWRGRVCWPARRCPLCSSLVGADGERSTTSESVRSRSGRK
jgi:hypothetical protein